MTHKEKLLALFAEFGLRSGCRQEYAAVGVNDYCLCEGGRNVFLGEGRNGYPGHFCEFVFDADGNFVEHKCQD